MTSWNFGKCNVEKQTSKLYYCSFEGVFSLNASELIAYRCCCWLKVVLKMWHWCCCFSTYERNYELCCLKWEAGGRLIARGCFHTDVENATTEWPFCLKKKKFYFCTHFLLNYIYTNYAYYTNRPSSLSAREGKELRPPVPLCLCRWPWGCVCTGVCNLGVCARPGWNWSCAAAQGFLNRKQSCLVQFVFGKGYLIYKQYGKQETMLAT